MKTLIFILSTAAIFFLTTCDEESPTTTSFSNGLRSIKLYDLNSNSVKKINDVYNVVYDCVYPDSNYFTYATYYRDLAELVVRNIHHSDEIYRCYLDQGPIMALQVYPAQNSIFLSNYEDVYSLNNYGEVVSNLTINDDGECSNPVFLPDKNLVIYGSYRVGYNNGRIFSQNLATSEIDTILSDDVTRHFPIFTTNDESHLIYVDYDLQYYSIKSIDLDDPQDIQVFMPQSAKTTVGKNKSIDDKIAFTSGGTAYLLDLDTGDLTEIISGAQFADISNDGAKVVFTTEFEMYLINSDGTQLEKIVSKDREKSYLFLPSFSLNDEQIIFVESEYPFAYYEFQIH
jgi:hypothetical protein